MTCIAELQIYIDDHQAIVNTAIGYGGTYCDGSLCSRIVENAICVELLLEGANTQTA